MTAVPGRRPLRPRLNPALRRVWRTSATLQIGVDPVRALLVDDVDPTTARLLADLDGGRTEAQVLADAAAAGMDVGEVGELLAGLHRGNALLDGVEAAAEPRSGRLAPDRAASSLTTAGAGLGDPAFPRGHRLRRRPGRCAPGGAPRRGRGGRGQHRGRRCRRRGRLRARRTHPRRPAPVGACGGPRRRTPRRGRRRHLGAATHRGPGPRGDRHRRPGRHRGTGRAAPRRRRAPGRGGARDHGGHRPARRPRTHQLPALRRPAPQRPRSVLAAGGRPVGGPRSAARPRHATWPSP